MPLPGVHPQEYQRIADLLGISLQCVWDLANYPDEARTSLSVAQVIDLARATGLTVTEIVNEERLESAEPLTHEQISILMRAAIVDGQSTMAEFEDRVGWNLAEAIETPDRLLDIYNWDGLSDVAGALGFNPWSILPPDAKSANKSSLPTGMNLTTSTPTALP
jgi:AraC-like DNA-binding protein